MVTLGVLLEVEAFFGDAESEPPQAASVEIRTTAAAANKALLFILLFMLCFIVFTSPMLEASSSWVLVRLLCLDVFL